MLGPAPRRRSQTRARRVRHRRTGVARAPPAARIRPPPRSPPGGTGGRDRPRPRSVGPPLARSHGSRRESWRARGEVRGPTEALTRIVGLTMDAGPRYLEGTPVGSGRDIIGVRRDRIADIISTGREIIARAKSEKILPDTITGATAALLVTIAGYGEPLSEGQWRELAGVVGGIMRDSTYADLAPLRTLITQEQFLNVARNPGYARFIPRLGDGRWGFELTPKPGGLPDAGGASRPQRG